MSTLLTRDEQAPPVVRRTGRRIGVDLARAIGLTAVVVGHLVVYGEVRALTFSWHVPLFFLLAGYLWKPVRRSLLSELYRRSSRVLVPYVLWLPAGVLATWWVHRSVGHAFSADDLVQGLLRGGLALTGPAAPFWFLTAFALAIVVVAATWRVSPLLSLGAGLAGTAAVTLHPAWSAWPFSAAPALVGVLLVVTGRGLAVVLPRVERPVVTGLALAVPGLLLAGAGITAPLDLRTADLGTPVASLVVAVVICAGLVLVCEGVAHRVPGAMAPVVTVFAEIAVPVFLLHLAIADLLVAEIPGVDRMYFAPLALAGAVAVGLAVRATSWRRFLL
jgi:acyltransferase